MSRYRVAVVPGDGVGKDVIPAGLAALHAAAAREDVALEPTTFPWGAEHYATHGMFMPDGGLDILRSFDAIYFGAIGHPSVDDSLPGPAYTFRIRKAFQQYVNLRPIRLLPGVEGPLRDRDARIDFVIVRENNEGELAGSGGILNPEQPNGVALQTSIFTRQGIERVAHYSFQLARTRRNKVTNVTKSNALTFGMRYWDQVIAEVRAEYPDVEYEQMYVDAAAMNIVLRPARFDVILTTNLFGDILSDLGGALVGSLGLCPSGNINPERAFPSMFEPIHGSARGRGIGRAICVGLAAGATVIVNDLHDDFARCAVVAEIVHSGGRALALLADVASAEQVEAMVARAVETCGRIDILVNNAGVIVRKPMLETTDEDWRRVFGANIDGCFYCTRAVARHMVARGGGGQIVNISSTNAAIGGAQRSAYAATKGAIESFTRCCALELAPHGIAVNAVSPGFTITDINAQLFTPTTLETLGARLAAGRVAEAYEIASTVVAVASGTLPYLVGQVIRVDGGWSSCDVDYTTTHMSAHKQ